MDNSNQNERVTQSVYLPSLWWVARLISYRENRNGLAAQLGAVNHYKYICFDVINSHSSWWLKQLSIMLKASWVTCFFKERYSFFWTLWFLYNYKLTESYKNSTNKSHIPFIKFAIILPHLLYHSSLSLPLHIHKYSHTYFFFFPPEL